MRNTVELGVEEISSWMKQKLKANFALAPINEWASWTSFNHFFLQTKAVTDQGDIIHRPICSNH